MSFKNVRAAFHWLNV